MTGLLDIFLRETAEEQREIAHELPLFPRVFPLLSHIRESAPQAIEDKP